MTVILRDITERKLAEEKLRTLANNLKRSNRELQDFATVASHDLQEPLRKIQAFGDRLKAKCAEALNEEGRDYLERMQNAAHRMQVMINDLLVLSRVTAKAQPYARTDLAEVARQVLSNIEVAIEREHGHVEVGDLPSVEADPSQMRHLLQNLVSNALKFHKKEEKPVIKIEGRLLRDQKEHPEASSAVVDQCQIIVKDNGIGFDEKYADRIFNVFQRVHSRSEYEGTGIGLAICRRIAERHGGSIKATSKPDQGATFIVTLPVQQLKARSTEWQEKSDESPS